MPRITIREGRWYLVTPCERCAALLVLGETLPDAPISAGEFEIHLDCEACHHAAMYRISNMKKVQASSEPPSKWTQH